MEKSSAARHFHEAGHSFSTLSFCVIKFLEVAEVVTLNRNVTIRKNIFFLENALFFLMKNYPSHVFYNVSSIFSTLPDAILSAPFLFEHLAPCK